MRRRIAGAEQAAPASGWWQPTPASDWHYFTTPGGSLCQQWGAAAPNARLESKPRHPILRMEPDECQVCAACLKVRRDQGETW